LTTLLISKPKRLKLFSSFHRFSQQQNRGQQKKEFTTKKRKKARILIKLLNRSPESAWKFEEIMRGNIGGENLLLGAITKDASVSHESKLIGLSLSSLSLSLSVSLSVQPQRQTVEGDG